MAGKDKKKRDAKKEKAAKPEAPAPKARGGKKKAGKSKAKSARKPEVEAIEPESAETEVSAAETQEAPAVQEADAAGIDLRQSALVSGEEKEDSSADNVDTPSEGLTPVGAAPTESGESAPLAAPSDAEKLNRTIEALLFAAEESVTPRELARAAGCKTAEMRTLLDALKERYETEQRPWELAEVAGGFRLVTRPEFHPAIQKLKQQRQMRKLTQAALETLAFIAYSKEPVGRSEIEGVRGVDSGPVLRQLLERKLISITGRGTGLGQPLLYTVSTDFLEHFGLRTVQDLPQPGEFKSQ